MLDHYTLSNALLVVLAAVLSRVQLVRFSEFDNEERCKLRQAEPGLVRLSQVESASACFDNEQRREYYP